MSETLYCGNCGCELAEGQSMLQAQVDRLTQKNDRLRVALKNLIHDADAFDEEGGLMCVSAEAVAKAREECK